MSELSSDRGFGSPRQIVIVGIVVGILAALGGVATGYGGPLAGMAVLIALGAAALTLRHLKAGFIAVIAVICLLPYGTVPIDLGLTLTLLDVSLGAVVAVWVVRFATGRTRRLVTAPPTIPLIIFIMVALFAFVLGLTNGPLTPQLLRRFAEYLLSAGFAVIIIDYVSNEERLTALTRALLYAGTIGAAMAIILWIMPDDAANRALSSLELLGYPGGFVIRYIEENPDNAERAIGTAADPNALGGLLLLVGSLMAPQVVARRPSIKRWHAVAGLGLIVVALFLTFSRGAMLGLIAAMMFLALIRYRRLIPYMAGMGLLLSLLPAAQGYISHLLAGVRGEDLATQMRFGEYTDALTLVGRYPLFGVGFAGSPDIDIYLGVSMIYLKLAQQMGLIGLISFLAIIVSIFSYARLHRGRFVGDRQLDPIWLGAHSALVGALVAGIFDHYLVNIDFHHAVTLFWLIVGLAVAATRVGSITAPVLAPTGD